MKKIIIALLFLSIFNNLSFSQILSKNAEAYILVCSPGTELYQAFGHNAIWIVDDSTHVNMIYHYGTFDYYSPHFYIHFIQGRLNYMLATESFNNFMTEYTVARRDVWKLKLNIDNQKVNELYSYLEWKKLDENKYYMYDFFMDNCATRVRDLMEIIYSDSLKYANNFTADLTYRQTIKHYLQAMPWTRFGINLILGLPADKKLDYYSAMYLPDYIDSVFTESTILVNNKSENFISKREYMIKSDFKIGERPFFNPTYTFWALFIILGIITFWEFKRKKFFKGINFSYFLITGITSLVLLFMWFLTDHTATKLNLNVIWAFPIHIYFAFVYLRGKKIKFIKKYLLIFSIINFLLIITYPIFPQHFDIALIPFFLIFSIRFILNSKTLKKEQ